MYAAAGWCAAVVAPRQGGNGHGPSFPVPRTDSSRHSRLTGAIGLTPAPASTAAWQINSVAGDPTAQVGFNSVAASGADNAWAAGLTNCDASCSTQTATVEQWNGRSWQPVTLPDNNLGGAGQLPVIGTSSASNTWIFDSDINNIGYGVHVTDSGATETPLPASGGIQFSGAAVFSADDTWAFGIGGDFNLATFSPYAAHFDGQAWTQLPIPLFPESVSAISGNSLWVLGSPSALSIASEVAHWTGTGWSTVPLPTGASLGLPADETLEPFGILGLSPQDVWITANISVGFGFGAGVLLLHWNGISWHAVDVPQATSFFDADMASDGEGGFWVSGYGSGFTGPYLYHFGNDHWTSQLAPTQAGEPVLFGGLAPIPGTTSLWGAATLLINLPDGTQGSQGAIYQYAP
jgi:hypothetical protein